VLTAEAFPTNLRATAFGLASAASRLAGTATPFVAGSMWEASPSGALGCYAVSAALCALTLLRLVDDTSRAPMPDEVTALAPASLCDGAAAGEHETADPADPAEVRVVA
jgi:hypothetical protein